MPRMKLESALKRLDNHLAKARDIIEDITIAMENYDDSKVTNFSVDVWGGAGPDCKRVRLAAAFHFTPK